ncbi:hexose carrier protein HEX6-like [Canna indica]|uniref:Hexose carrier protein HEX6-like n=1 Tax=Canna indica TaxID=4628 RepID=A0AAQ3QSU3_9LILI|nr:hexose carrier protein HEX6-like [Canna indica]
MAAELAGNTQEYKGRITHFMVLSCTLAASGGVLFGYDLGVSGGVTSMEPFLRKFFPDVDAKKHSKGSSRSAYCKFDSQLLTAFTSSLYVAGLLASLCASPVTRASGRRASMLLGGAAFMVGAALGGFSLNIYMLIFGRVFLGIGVGFANQAVPVYLSELAPPQHRGAINNAFDFFIGLGIASANLINYGTHKLHSSLGWRISLGLAIVPATILTVGTLFLPETLNSLLQQSDYSRQKATKILQRLRGTDNVHNELEDMIFAANASKAITQPFFCIMMKRKYRPQFVMVILISFFKQMTGITMITFYSPIIFQIIGMGESSSLLSTTIVGIISVGSIVLAMIMVDKVGRRTLFFIGGALMLVAHLVVGGVLEAKLGDHGGGVSRSHAYLVSVFLCAFVAGFGVSWGPLGWLVPSEILPLEIRSAGQSTVVAVTLLFAAINGQSLLAMLCRLKSGVFFFFGGWVMIMTVFVAVMLPETKNVPIEKMDQIWREHWFWSKYVMEEDDN